MIYIRGKKLIQKPIILRFLWTALLALSAATPTLGATGPADIQPILKTYCFSCHGGKKTKAGISFASFKDELNVWRDRRIWLRVSDAIKSRSPTSSTA
jgi:hypothetical protein